MNQTERIETPATRRRDAAALFTVWAAMELLSCVMRVRTMREPPYTAEEVALRLTVVTLTALGAVAAWRGWRGWRGVRLLAPMVGLVAAASHALTGVRAVVWHERVYRHGFEVAEIAVPVGLVSGALFMGLGLWYIVRRDLT